MVVQVVDDEKISVWRLGMEAGVMRLNPLVVNIKEPGYDLKRFSGCWIRYPLVSDLLVLKVSHNY